MSSFESLRMTFAFYETKFLDKIEETDYCFGAHGGDYGFGFSADIKARVKN